MRQKKLTPEQINLIVTIAKKYPQLYQQLIDQANQTCKNIHELDRNIDELLNLLTASAR
jgi:hypothetical protein